MHLFTSKLQYPIESFAVECFNTEAVLQNSYFTGDLNLSMSVSYLIDEDAAVDLAMLMSSATQTKVYHWASRDYSKHKALDELHEALLENTDKFVESYLGAKGKVPFAVTTGVLSTTQPAVDGDPKNVLAFLRKLHDDVKAMMKRSYLEDEPGLENIVQDLLGHVEQATYLYMLH